MEKQMTLKEITDLVQAEFDALRFRNKTAVAWLMDSLGYKHESGKTIISIHPDCDITDLVEQAKQKEKEQKINFAFDFYYHYSIKSNVPFNLITENRMNAEQYYNETYNK